MKARDVMTTPVVTVQSGAPFKDVVRVLMDHDVSGLPVVDESGALVGIVTEADLVSKEAYPGRRPRLLSALIDVLDGDARWRHKAEGLTVADVMTPDPVVTGPDESVTRLARRMLASGIKRIPIVDGDRLVGIVTRHDLVAVFDRSDDAIADDIRARLASPRYTPERHTVTFGVSHGVVTLEGSVYYRSDRGVIEGMARDVPGVVGVDSKLDYIHPDPSLWP